MTTLRLDGSPGLATLVLAHGAGAGMDSDTMNACVTALVGAGLAVARFEFAYMAARREGRRPPPPRIPVLVPEFARAAAEVLAGSTGPVLIGGKSMGSRVAARLGGEPLDPRVAGVVALGFPFHPPGKPERTRLDDLAASRLPVLVCQGERDPFGTRAEVEAYALGDRVSVTWLADGDHDLRPRRAAGRTFEQNLAAMAEAVAGFARAQSASG